MNNKLLLIPESLNRIEQLFIKYKFSGPSSPSSIRHFKNTFKATVTSVFEMINGWRQFFKQLIDFLFV